MVSSCLIFLLYLIYRNDDDKDAFVKIAMRLNDTLADPIPSPSTKQLASLAYSAEGCFAPLCAALGGFVAQEVLKALTGKFTPLKQWVSDVETSSLSPPLSLRSAF